MTDPRYLTREQREASAAAPPGTWQRALCDHAAAADEMLDKERRLRVALRGVLRCHKIPDEPAPCATCTCDACIVSRWIDDATGTKHD